jgi:uncharacterized protein YdaU (DUF1376 family)
VSDKKIAPNWYRKFPAVYLSSTLGFDLQMHGLYNLILDVSIVKGRPLTEAEIYNLGVGAEETWQKIKFKFIKDGETFVSERLEEERERAISASEAASGKGKRGAKARWKKSTSNSTSNSTGNAPAIAQAMQNRIEENRIEKPASPDPNSTKPRKLASEYEALRNQVVGFAEASGWNGTEAAAVLANLRERDWKAKDGGKIGDVVSYVLISGARILEIESRKLAGRIVKEDPEMASHPDLKRHRQLLQIRDKLRESAKCNGKTAHHRMTQRMATTAQTMKDLIPG